MVESIINVSKLRSRRPSHATVVAYVALFVALGGSSYAAIRITSKNVPKDALTGADIKNLTGKDVRNNSLTGADVKNLTGGDVANGRLRAEDFAAGQLPAGPQGPQGARGQTGGRGPSFGDGKHVSNTQNLSCGDDVVVGSQPLTVTTPSRIWAYGHGTVVDNNAGVGPVELWLRVRNAGNTATLAVSPMGSEELEMDGDAFLSSGGLMLSGEDQDGGGPPLVAPAGTYILELVVNAGDVPCPINPKPDFGFNGGNTMGYALLGTSP